MHTTSSGRYLLVTLFLFLQTPFQAAGQTLAPLDLLPGQETISAEPFIRGDSLTLQAALRRAMVSHPSLEGARAAIRAGEARLVQAGKRLNPALSIEFGKQGQTPAGAAAFESTILLEQTLRLGNKRGHSKTVAAGDIALSQWSARSRALDLYTEVHGAYNLALIAREDLRLKEELLGIARNLHEGTRQRVGAGKASPAEAARAAIILARHEMALSRARETDILARETLAGICGIASGALPALSGNFDALISLPPQDSLRSLLNRNPALAAYQAAEARQMAAIALADAGAIPDPVIGGGIKYLNSQEDVAVLFSLSLPLPLTDRNQGDRLAAREILNRIRAERRALALQLGLELDRARRAFELSRSEVLALREKIIPGAELAFQNISEGYARGRFNFLDLLDAQRTLFESRDSLLHALREFHGAAIEIEKLTASALH
ncbi:MAG TPA: TolC family protein [Calditrichia bacterium]|nr:TolC family protein [Calditrichota bacterium]HQU71386.1 TolC family protein [Calditrichia bacterium]HQV30862.1 TolC family protein [Calditrichia bacterium]